MLTESPSPSMGEGGAKRRVGVMSPISDYRSHLVENAFDHLRGALDDAEQNARGAIGAPPPLFPFLQGARVEAEPVGEFALAQAEFAADGADIDLRRRPHDMLDAPALVAPGESDPILP